MAVGRETVNGVDGAGRSEAATGVGCWSASGGDALDYLSVGAVPGHGG
jgi:hypothetical protein